MFVLALAIAAAEPETPLPDWPFRPYAVAVDVIGGRSPAAGVSDRMVSLLSSALGPACELDVSFRTSPRGPDALAGFDKHLILRADANTVSASERDLWLRFDGPDAVRELADPALRSQVWAGLAAAVFRPRVRLTMNEEGDVSGTLWGSAIDGGRLLGEEDLLRPVVRFVDRAGALRETRPLPWTFLRVTERTPLECLLEVISPMREPVPSRVRRGTVVGLVTRAVHTPPPLLLSFEDGRPAGGLFVELRGVDAGPDADPIFRAMTDRAGRVNLPAVNGPAWCSVSSDSVLTRVPLLPGEKPVESLMLTDDAISLRLSEGLRQVEADLTAAIGSRAVLLARARKATEEEQWARADAAFESLDELPGIDELVSRINATRVIAERAARSAGRRREAAAAKLRADRLALTVRQFLDAKPIQDLKDEVAELRRIAIEAERIRARSAPKPTDGRPGF